MICGNATIKQLIKKSSPFSISRSSDQEMISSYRWSIQNDKNINDTLHILHNNAGIYFSSIEFQTLRTPDSKVHDRIRDELDSYCNEYISAIETSDYFAVWQALDLTDIENDIIKRFNLKHFKAQDLEPYYFQFKDPWSKYLESKKVLVIHPFQKTIYKQYEIKSKLFEDKSVLPDFNLTCVKAVSSLGGNRPHGNWIESFYSMIGQIEKIDFDIALLGCGGYGLPLVGHIKNVMHKSAIYMGGSLQILFGIKGVRWDKHNIVKNMYNEFWTRPLENDKVLNYHRVENGCYW